MSLQNIGKATLRVAKNYTKGYSDVQAKVREATSNDPWGPSGSQMNEIAQLTYNQNDFVEIMEMIDKRLNDKGKNWRHVFKALTVLDYCLHAGSENCVLYFKDNIYIVKTLKEFQYMDEYDKDQGANVRQKAKDITNLLMDEARLKEARKNRASMRDRMLGGQNSYDDDDMPLEPRQRSRSVPPANTGKKKNKEEDDLKRALEASKASFDRERGKAQEDNDLAAAIKASEEEEAARRRAAEGRDGGLFDENHQPSANTSTNNPFPLINFDAQPAEMQPQPQFLQPQFTAFNPYQQQAEQEAMQAEYLRQQQQAQQDEWMHQQLLLQQQAQQQAQQEEWMRQQQQQQLLAQQQQDQDRQRDWWMQQQQQQQQAQQQQEYERQQQQQQQMLLAQQQGQQQIPQPTGFGTNNPFALSSPTQPPQAQEPPRPASQPPPQTQTPVQRPPREDGKHAQLANLLAGRGDDGIDTFGNIGALRYGHTTAGIRAQQAAGPNPFRSASQPQVQAAEQPFFSI